jgi:hypothetical protein
VGHPTAVQANRKNGTSGGPAKAVAPGEVHREPTWEELLVQAALRGYGPSGLYVPIFERYAPGAYRSTNVSNRIGRLGELSYRFRTPGGLFRMSDLNDRPWFNPNITDPARQWQRGNFPAVDFIDEGRLVSNKTSQIPDEPVGPGATPAARTRRYNDQLDEILLREQTRAAAREITGQGPGATGPPESLTVAAADAAHYRRQLIDRLAGDPQRFSAWFDQHMSSVTPNVPAKTATRLAAAFPQGIRSLADLNQAQAQGIIGRNVRLRILRQAADVIAGQRMTTTTGPLPDTPRIASGRQSYYDEGLAVIRDPGDHRVQHAARNLHPNLPQAQGTQAIVDRAILAINEDDLGLYRQAVQRQLADDPGAFSRWLDPHLAANPVQMSPQFAQRIQGMFPQGLRSVADIMQAEQAGLITPAHRRALIESVAPAVATERVVGNKLTNAHGQHLANLDVTAARAFPERILAEQHGAAGARRIAGMRGMAHGGAMAGGLSALTMMLDGQDRSAGEVAETLLTQTGLGAADAGATSVLEQSMMNYISRRGIPALSGRALSGVGRGLGSGAAAGVVAPLIEAASMMLDDRDDSGEDYTGRMGSAAVGGALSAMLAAGAVGAIFGSEVPVLGNILGFLIGAGGYALWELTGLGDWTEEQFRKLYRGGAAALRWFANTGLGRRLVQAGEWMGDRAGRVGSWMGDRAGRVGSWIGDRAGRVGRWLGNTWMGRAGSWVGDRLGEAGSWAWDKASRAGSWVGDRLGEAGSWAWGHLSRAGSWVGDRLGEAGSWAWGHLSRAGSWVGDRLGEAGSWAWDKASQAGRWIADSRVGRAVGAAGSWAADKLGAAGSWAWDKASQAGSWVGDRLGEAASWTGDRLGEAADWAGGHLPRAGQWIADSRVGRAVSAAGSWAGDKLSAAGSWAGRQLDAAGTWAGQKLDAAGAWAGRQLDSAGTWAGNALDSAGSWAGRQLDNAGSWVGNKLDSAGSAISDAWSYIWD